MRLINDFANAYLFIIITFFKTLLLFETLSLGIILDKWVIFA
jgi:hypothetical protein